MSLPTTGFTFGSASSAQSVRDVIASYRRAQFLVVESTLPSSPDLTDSFDEESGSIIEEEDESDGDSFTPAQRQDDDDFVGQFEWDSLNPGSPSPRTPPSALFVPSSPRSTFISPPVSVSPPPRADEETPLLPSSNAIQEVTRRPCGSSTFKDFTVFCSKVQVWRGKYIRSNCMNIQFQFIAQAKIFLYSFSTPIAILLGIGMLSTPLAFAYAGWIPGTILIGFYGFVSCYTAKILAQIIRADPRLRSYTDIGRKAFGPRSTGIISAIFCLELFSVSVILVTLYADSLHAIIPYYSSNTYKLWGLLIIYAEQLRLIPTVFLPLSLLSYTSVLGIISTILMIAVILIDGATRKEQPGSLWSPAETSLGIESWRHLGIAYGLFMAGFSGHAVIPSLVRDMEDPSEFDKMITWAFVVATLIYGLIGYAGYIMFGISVSEEISMDLLSTPGYNPALNQACLWMLVISPMSKFALATQPLNATIEILLGIDLPPATHEDVAKRLAEPSHGTSRKRILGMILRVALTVLSVGVSVLVPDFSAVMAFLGSFSAFLIVVIGPIGAHIAIKGSCGVFEAVAVGVAVVMAGWGTVAAFLSA
ncbi:transmembrane amino acid transporter protein-domain-containing protein [Desarmillaria tabescens]|uniref:Transmembrane amino acid transporter protein-domain-containing protein n=1 Tax=Armillaria tabescens TaxID=1929756 RepID=A0AA39T565_ARMTA|nr:transmembrane amino acid transporter protein-domain-containing protein [Desarmillaria tabescens]KAK0465401.1 transmembrane amino acid transporter protein-domain-containing protein [Desarmillaria tabescens]